MADKQIFELPIASIDDLKKGTKKSFIIQIDGYDLDFQVPPDVMAEYITFIQGVPTQQTPTTVNATAIYLPVKTTFDLKQDGLDWYIDLTAANLPNRPNISVYVDTAGNGQSEVSIPTSYDNISKHLKGFDDPNISPYQKIYISYIGVSTGGGTTPPSGTAQLVAVDKDNPGMFYNVLFDSTTKQFYPELNTTATAASDYAAVDKDSPNRYRVLYNSNTQTFYPELI